MHHSSSAHRRSLRLFAAVVLGAIACLLFSAAIASAADFDPELILSDSTMRASDSMTAQDIQSFLNTQPGPLKSLVTTDHTGVKKPAAVIISEATKAWGISPKVMLALLQKEQSLLTRTTLATNTLSRAIGAGCPNSYTNKYPGFGNQMWNGSRLLDSYGEGKGGSTIPLYHLGISRTDIYRTPNVTIYPKNLATYKLYVYNPSVGAAAPYGDLSSQAGRTSGNANLWLIYQRYFGSPVSPPRMARVYRFKNRSNGSYLYTASVSERYKLVANSYKTWTFEGSPFSVDTSVPTLATVPVYRFYNKYTHKYSFTRSEATKSARVTTSGQRTWRFDGTAFRVANMPSQGSVTVWQFQNRKTYACFLTTSARTVAMFRSDPAHIRDWKYIGPFYYLPRVSVPSTTTP